MNKMFDYFINKICLINVLIRRVRIRVRIIESVED